MKTQDRQSVPVESEAVHAVTLEASALLGQGMCNGGRGPKDLQLDLCVVGQAGDGFGQGLWLVQSYSLSHKSSQQLRHESPPVHMSQRTLHSTSSH